MYQLSATEAVVETVDFFTPVVDDPFLFGRIAAANAFSDIWAMGARPLFALNLVAFPVGKLPMETLGEILRGGAAAAAEAGAPILGGHSIDDPEPKYGMAVTGLVHPDRVLRNVGARPGDRILLTKPLGSGIVTTAIKRGEADPALVDRAVGVMAALNRAAGEVLAASGAVHALTDVTGFGLLGHALEMAQGSGVTLRLDARAVPILEGVRALAERDVAPGGSRANLAWVAPHVRFDASLDAPARLVLADAQTNGGLLAAVAPERLDELAAALKQAGVQAAVVGACAPASDVWIEVGAS
ncbi:selenide, water dikinase [Anaeromyxobacter diazotrophicus]|uniref:Selenide, water dikinase n=1 Tax=Anaeromyxobacter diazotrophicus TaxID=2590199 RepID=A0A7I9VIE1_9BACT|nr:selenide, water dikinase [Anaeromyxobacter diazotrophicus]